MAVRGGGGGGPKKTGAGKVGGDSNSGDSTYSYEGEMDMFPLCRTGPACPKWV